MISKKWNLISTILIILIILVNINLVSAYTVNSIEVDSDFITNTNQAHTITGVLAETTSDPVELNIKSDADSVGLDFNAIVTDTTFSASFYTTTDTSTTYNTWPKIQVNDIDSIVVSAIGQDPARNYTVVYDSLAPNNGSISNVVPQEGSNFDTFYSGDFNVNYSAANDADTFIDKYIIYLVSISDILNYESNYEYIKVSDNNSTLSLNIDSVLEDISDGNYYVLLDANDIAGNTCSLEDVVDTNVNIYIDNTAPNYDVPTIGHFSDENILYINEDTFNLDLSVDDISDIDEGSSVLEIYDPVDTRLADVLYSSGSFSFTPSGTYNNGDLFKFYLDAYDKVDNLLEFDFNIFFDLNSPTIPQKAETFLDIDADKNITITWLASSDDESGIKNYEIYRSTSSFTTITTQTKIHTTSDSSTLTYIDDDDKDQGSRYYYGVVALDYANNSSEPVVDSIHSGPEVDLEIENDDEYTNKATPRLEIEFSSDVNEMRFSCNDSSWSSWIEVDGDDEVYEGFNITSGNGCNSDNEEKTIYVQVRSEDDYPDKTSKASNTIHYDSIAPSIPSNVEISEDSDGGVTISWNRSNDNNSDVEYRLYYSLDSGVTLDSNYFDTDDLSYLYNPNKDQKVYFRVSAYDEAGNESALSSEVSGNTQRFGPTFSLDILPSNIYDNQLYVGKGSKILKVESDEDLTSAPTFRVKVNNGSYITIPVNFDGSKISTSDYNFQECGLGEIKISGSNKDLEAASDIFNFVIDANEPVFDLNYTINDTNYNFYLENYSSDIFRVQYLLNNQDEICIKQKDENTEVVDFNCTLDTLSIDDGEYDVYVVSYDYALNTKVDVFNLVIDNVNEVEEESISLKKEIEDLIVFIERTINQLTQLLVDVEDSIEESLLVLKQSKQIADEDFDSNNFSSARDLYTQINTELLDIKEKLPEKTEVKNKTLSYILDSNYESNLTSFTLDANTLKDTNALYFSNAITIDRNFVVQEINSKKYFTNVLEFNNNSNQAQVITIVETIPKAFADNVKNLVFNKEVEVLVEDPVIKYTLTIPANSSEILRYNRISPVTDVDVVTKFNSIVFTQPLILAGDVPASKIIYDKPINYMLLIYIVSGMLLLVIALMILGLISKHKELKTSKLGKTGTKEVMNAYFSKGPSKDGSKDEDKSEADANKDKSEDDKNNLSNSESKIDKQKNAEAEEKRFKEDYSFIMNAIKKRE